MTIKLCAQKDTGIDAKSEENEVIFTPETGLKSPKTSACEKMQI